MLRERLQKRDRRIEDLERDVGDLMEARGWLQAIITTKALAKQRPNGLGPRQRVQEVEDDQGSTAEA